MTAKVRLHLDVQVDDIDLGRHQVAGVTVEDAGGPVAGYFLNDGSSRPGQAEGQVLGGKAR